MAYPEQYLPSLSEIEIIERTANFFENLTSQGIDWRKYLHTADETETQFGTHFAVPELETYWRYYTGLHDPESAGFVLVRNRFGTYPHMHSRGTSIARVLQGEGRFIVGMYDYRLFPGRNFPTPPNTGHYVILGGKGAMLPDAGPEESQITPSHVYDSPSTVSNEFESTDKVRPGDVFFAVIDLPASNLSDSAPMPSLDDYKAFGIKNPRLLWQKYS